MSPYNAFKLRWRYPGYIVNGSVREFRHGGVHSEYDEGKTAGDARRY